MNSSNTQPKFSTITLTEWQITSSSEEGKANRLSSVFHHSTSQDAQAADAIIIDGAVAVNMIRPGTERPFAEYSTQSFLPYVQSQLSHAKRVDVVWGEYVANNLKATTRSKRVSNN